MYEEFPTARMTCLEKCTNTKADPAIKAVTGNSVRQYLVENIISAKHFDHIVNVLISNELTDVLTERNEYGQTLLQLAEYYLNIHKQTKHFLRMHGILK